MLFAVTLILGSVGFVMVWGAHVSGPFFGPARHVPTWPIYLGALGILGGIALLIFWRQDVRRDR